MTPAAIIREAQSEGVKLTLSHAGTIKAIGDGTAVNRWLAVIRENKAEIVEALKIGAGGSPGSLGSPQKIECTEKLQQKPSESSVPFWRWSIHFSGRDPLEVSFSPTATHAEALTWYPDAVAAETIPDSQPSACPMSDDEEKAIRGWLALIEEIDPATIAEVIGQCQRDADAKDYFTGRAGHRSTPH